MFEKEIIGRILPLQGALFSPPFHKLFCRHNQTHNILFATYVLHINNFLFFILNIFRVQIPYTLLNNANKINYRRNRVKTVQAMAVNYYILAFIMLIPDCSRISRSTSWLPLSSPIVVITESHRKSSRMIYGEPIHLYPICGETVSASN